MQEEIEDIEILLEEDKDKKTPLKLAPPKEYFAVWIYLVMALLILILMILNIK